jgi:hypothetical protein
MVKFFEKSVASSAIKIGAVYSLDTLLTTYQAARCHMTRKITLCVFITIKSSNLMCILKFGHIKLWALEMVLVEFCCAEVNESKGFNKRCLSLIRQIQSVPSHIVSLIYTLIIFQYLRVSSKRNLSVILYTFWIAYAFYMAYPSKSPCYDNHSNISWELFFVVYLTMLLVSSHCIYIYIYIHTYKHRR